MLKSEVFKANSRNASYFPSQDQNGGRKNILTLNHKILAILSSNPPNQIHYLDTKVLRNRFSLREH